MGAVLVAWLLCNRHSPGEDGEEAGGTVIGCCSFPSCLSALGPGQVWRLSWRLTSILAGLQVEFINPIFEFSRAMRRLGLDDAEYALLIAINIFSADRPNVQEPSRVEALQQPYVEALLSYTRIKRPQVQGLPVPSWAGSVLESGGTCWGTLSLGPAFLLRSC